MNLETLWSHCKRFLGRLRIISCISLTQARKTDERIGKYPHLAGYSYSFPEEKEGERKNSGSEAVLELARILITFFFFREISFLWALAKWLLDAIIFSQERLKKYCSQPAALQIPLRNKSVGRPSVLKGDVHKNALN